MTRSKLIKFLDQELLNASFPDIHLNGLQVEGHETIGKVGVAVDCGVSIIERAASEQIDLLIVHHGLIWDKPAAITGPLRRALELLIKNGINLYASHLPLDAHRELGNNFGLARLLGLAELVPAIPFKTVPIGCLGVNSCQTSLTGLVEILTKLPGALSPIFTLSFGPEIPERVCVVTGSGSDALYRAAEEGFDTLVTGEPRQFAYHFAKERNLNLLCAGHYATETIGVQCVAKEIERRWGVPWSFIHEPTGI